MKLFSLFTKKPASAAPAPAGDSFNAIAIEIVISYPQIRAASTDEVINDYLAIVLPDYLDKAKVYYEVATFSQANNLGEPGSPAPQLPVLAARIMQLRGSEDPGSHVAHALMLRSIIADRDQELYFLKQRLEAAEQHSDRMLEVTNGITSQHLNAILPEKRQN